MTEQENVKVYELAKELGIDSISLLDKLRALNIQVKSHMSDLGPEDLQTARRALGKAPETPAKAKKPAATRARKKAPAPTATAGEAPGAGATAAPSSAEPAAAKATAGEKKPGASAIIRRRGRSEGGETLVASHMTAHSAAESETAASLSASGAFHAESAEISGTEVGSLGTDRTGTSDMMKLGAEAPQASEHGLSASAGSESTPATGVMAGAAQPYLPPARPSAPRKSFLTIVQPTVPAPRPVIKPAGPITPASTKEKSLNRGAATTDRDGFRIIKMTKENLDQMVEEEAARKRGTTRELEIRPEDVRFADFRKKEMVFLPKKKKLPVGKELKKTQITEAKAQKRVVEMGQTITVGELAAQLSVKATDLIRKLMGMGQMASMNQALDFDTASLIAAEYKYEVRNVAFNEETLLGTNEDQPEQLQPRPPVVTIMGHVDHGKTTLLDSLREANVAAGEAGGITQHIGAYTVEKNGKLITFIDTPGHEAFTVMRARGANVTDIVILVVAADDGVMPQTREALSHAQAAGVPIIVAVNKVDKPGANPEKIKQGLAELNLLAEDWGGETMFIPVSALKKTNLDKLLDAILLQAEVLDLKGNPDARASGTVLEARLERGRGAVVSLLVKRGTLRVGDPIVSGPFCGKIKAISDDKGRVVNEVTPGIAAEILGFEGVPSAGEPFRVASSEADARAIAENRADHLRAAKGAQGAQSAKMSLEDLFSKVQAGATKELNVILKADVFGSVEAIRDSLTKLSNEKVKVKVIHAAPGGITESDVLLASASNAIIIGFNVRPETTARQVAEAEHVDVKCYNIIYELLDDVKNAMTGLLDKKKVEKFLGRAEVRQVFNVPKIGAVAGSAVIDGKIIRGANVRLLRDSRVIFEGKMSSLRRFKDDAKEVASGYECGIGIENYNDVKPGDIIEAFQIEMIAPTLEGV